MKVIEIQASYGETISYGRFSNFRVDVSAKVELETGEHAEVVHEQLFDALRSTAEGQIDSILEQHDETPIYYQAQGGELFVVTISHRRKCVGIFGLSSEIPSDFYEYAGSHSGHTKGKAHSLAARVMYQRDYGDYTIFDVTADQSELPPLPAPEKEARYHHLPLAADDGDDYGDDDDFDDEEEGESVY